MTTGIDPAINITTSKKFDDFPTCFLQNFEKCVGLLWIKSEQVLEELYVELHDFKGVEMKCKLSNASMAPVQTILDFDLFFIYIILIWNSSKIIKNLQKKSQPDAKNFINITGDQVAQIIFTAIFYSKILNIIF